MELQFDVFRTGRVSSGFHPALEALARINHDVFRIFRLLLRLQLALPVLVENFSQIDRFVRIPRSETAWQFGEFKAAEGQLANGFQLRVRGIEAGLDFEVSASKEARLPLLCADGKVHFV